MTTKKTKPKKRQTQPGNGEVSAAKVSERSSPLGLFNYARSYWQAAVWLHGSAANVAYPDAPITLLMAHAIELYLKAYLLLHGVSADEAKHTFGHDFEKLLEAAHDRGLVLSDKDKAVATLLKEQESIRRSQYVETGHFTQPTVDALSNTCERLDQSLASALQSAGINTETRS